LPLGQISTEILNIKSALLKALHIKCDEFLSTIDNLIKVKNKTNPELASDLQIKFNSITKIILTLPLFNRLKTDMEYSDNVFTGSLKEYTNDFISMFTQGTNENAQLQKMVLSYISIPQLLQWFKDYLALILDQYFENIKRRNPAHYAQGFYEFMKDDSKVKDMHAHFSGNRQFGFLNYRETSVEFSAVLNPNSETGYSIAEKMILNSIGDFLHLDFFRGLLKGNAPRRCHNCGKFFLLTAGFNTCYCNNIAPGEKFRTCRKIGAHKKEAAKAKLKTPVQQEYTKVYNRLKTRKNRGKISVDDWNAAVARAMDIRDMAEQGEIGDEKMRIMFGEI